MTKWLMLLALVGGLAVLNSTGHAQNKSSPFPMLPPTAPGAKPERTLYLVRNGDPVALAAVLGKHFKGEAEVSALPAGSGNGILISASPAATAEVAKLLERLDRQPKSVVVSVTLAEVTAKKDKDGKEVALPELTGTSGEVLAKVEALAKSGQVGSHQRITLTAVEGQPVSAMIGGDRPVTTGGARVAPGGPFQRSITYRTMGTTVKLTAQVGTGNAVAVDLSVQNSRLRPAEAGEEGEAPAFETSTLASKVSIPNGQAVTAQAVRTDAKASKGVTLVIVTATVIEPEPQQSN